MTTFRSRWPWVAGIIVVAVFGTLLSLRLGLFPEPQGTQEAGRTERRDLVGSSDTWLGIFQHGQKIGYAHRTMAPMDDGFELTDDLFMRINTMGVVQGLTFKTRGKLNRDMSLSSFEVLLTSNMFRFAARGRCVGKDLTLYVGEPGGEKSHHLILGDVPYLSGSVAEAAFRAGLKTGESKTFNIFDPASLGVRPVKVSLLGVAVKPLGGKEQKVTILSSDFMGARQTAWLDEQGQVVREEGILGLVLERSSRSEARQGISSAAGVDLTEMASVEANLALAEPTALSLLKVKLSHFDAGRFFLHGGRQTYRYGLLTIRRERLATEDSSGSPPDAGERESYLQPTMFVQADHPRIRAVVGEIISSRDDAAARMEKIVHWVYRSLEKQPVLSVSNAVETLAKRKGDCTEHAVLVAALSRAAGVPSTIETGLVYQKGRFYYHAWNVFFIDKWNRWITADAVFDQVPADVTHIRFVRGEAQEQLDLLGLMGRVKLEIIP